MTVHFQDSQLQGLPLSHSLCIRDIFKHMVACRYADTVIYRIMYKMDRLGSGRLHLRDLKRYVYAHEFSQIL